MTTNAMPSRTSEVVTYRPTAHDWLEAREKALTEAGLTFDELAEQARTRNFQSAQALSLWVTFGDSEV